MLMVPLPNPNAKESAHEHDEEKVLLAEREHA